MTEPVYEIDGAVELTKAFKSAPEIVEKVGVRALTKATALLEREVKERTPFGVSGLLRDSITAQQPYRSSFDGLVGVVSSPLDYAVCVELGTKPHYPPLEPIKRWVLKKLGLPIVSVEPVARSIAWKIRAHGTKGARMFAKAFAANKTQVERILSVVPEQVAREIKKAAKQ